MDVSGTGASCDMGNVPDWFQGLDALLKTTQSSSLKQAFNEFGEWRAVVGGWDDGAHFVDGKHYPLPTVTVELATFPRSAWLDAREYGTRYLEYVPNSESEGSLVVTITGKTETTWSGAILLWHAGEKVQRVDLAFDDATGIATAETGPLLNVQRVLIFVSQLTDGTHSTDAQDYDNARFFKYAVTQRAGLDAGAPPGPDAAVTGLDASAADAAIIDGWDVGAATRADGGANPHSGGGCGCAAAGAPGALVGLLALGLVFLKRRRP
jgi:MYXO-CTERM domain-containing protein